MIWPRRVITSGRLPCSAVHDMLWHLCQFGSKLLRYVACVCPWCGQRNRVIVRTGGGAMSVGRARAEYGELMSSALFNMDAPREPVWTAGSTDRGLSQCGACMKEWSISMHANMLGASGTPVPLPDHGEQIGERVWPEASGKHTQGGRVGPV